MERDESMNKRTIVVVAVVWLVIMVAGASSAITMYLLGEPMPFQYGDITDGKRVTDEEYATIQRYKRLDEVRSILERDYYMELDDETLMTGAIDGMMASTGDPYTFYYTPEDMQEMNERSSGQYQGIGIQLTGDKNGQIVVTRVFKDTPARRAGMQARDIIVSVDGEAVSAANGKDLDDAIARIKTGDGKSVEIDVLRNGEEMRFTVAKEQVNMNRVEYQILENNIGYLMLYEFMGDDVTGFTEAIEVFQRNQIRGMILDLRGNPGGLLEDVVQIADTLLPKGMVVYIEDRYGRREERYSDGSRYDVPLVVLIDGMSASASEILAGAVQDYGAGLVVGENSYGKGIVQTLMPFRSDGAGMQLTTSRYFTPKGRAIHGVGIVPDVEVKLDEDVEFIGDQADIQRDNQLRRAVEELEKMIGKREAA